MKKRATRFDLKGEVVHRYEADDLLSHPGTAALVRRGVLRSIVIACPDGCGEQLTINLDSRAGPAWRYYSSNSEVSLFPSVWRDSGCRSHFIVWRSRIYWCDGDEEFEVPMADVVEQVRGALGHRFESYASIANRLELVPWAVLSASHQLCRDKVAVEGEQEQRGHFKRAPTNFYI